MKMIHALAFLSLISTSVFASHSLLPNFYLVNNDQSTQKVCPISSSIIKKQLNEETLTKMAKYRSIDKEAQDFKNKVYGLNKVFTDYNPTDTKLGFRTVNEEIYEETVTYLSNRESLSVYGSADCSQKFIEVVGSFPRAEGSYLDNGRDVDSKEALELGTFLKEKTQALCDSLNKTETAVSSVQLINKSTYNTILSGAYRAGKNINYNVIARCLLNE